MSNKINQTMSNEGAILIFNKILELEIKATEKRLNRLIEIGAPDIIIENTKKNIEQFKLGIIKINDKQHLLSKTFEKLEVKTGRGGVEYIQFNGNINYFPNGKYGKFIKIAE